jgi:hypothetical protein
MLLRRSTLHCFAHASPRWQRGDSCPGQRSTCMMIISRQFDKLFKPDTSPETVVYIHLRVSRAVFDRCVSCGRAGVALPDLPSMGYIEAKYTVGLPILQRWLDAMWTPVGSKLCSNTKYRDEFIAPIDATAVTFGYCFVRGVPGRRRQPKAPAVKFCATSIRCLDSERKAPMLEMHDYCSLRHIISHSCL